MTYRGMLYHAESASKPMGLEELLLRLGALDQESTPKNTTNVAENADIHISRIKSHDGDQTPGDADTNYRHRDPHEVFRPCGARNDQGISSATGIDADHKITTEDEEAAQAISETLPPKAANRTKNMTKAHSEIYQ
jgi:hypothetical protein